MSLDFMGIIMRMKLRNTDNKVRMMAMFFNKHYISNKDSANRAEYETKDEVFCFYSRGAAYLRHAVANIVKAERNAKQKTKFFVFIAEAHPIFAAQRQCIKNEHESHELLE